MKGDRVTGISHRQDQDEFRGATGSLFRIALAPTVWAFHFLFCYAGAAVWCAKFGTQEGITFLLIDMASPGVSVRPILLISGASPFCETRFDHVQVPLRQEQGERQRGE